MTRRTEAEHVAAAGEPVVAGCVAAAVASALLWLGPPGADLAAHLYQRALFLEDGLTVWNNFWYAGRYSFVTYSVLYYPLAALVGIRVLAVLTVAVGAAAFAVLCAREWGRPARWSTRTFAVVWGCVVLTAAFPFLLGVALALLTLCALQAGRRIRFACFLLLTASASPLAFLLLCVVLAAIALDKHKRTVPLGQPAAIVLAVGILELLLWRAFTDGGRYPFSLPDAAAACTFCLIGLGVTWRVAAARLLRDVFVIYLGACVLLFLVPSSIGENVARLRFVAIPLAVLALSLRAWRPRPVAAIVLALAVSWNLSPLAWTMAGSSQDPAAHPAYWRGAIAFLKAHLTPSYRVEAVDTFGHWPATYLAGAHIPIARGWFRQDDFPLNRVLYGPLSRGAYLRWLRTLGVRFVVAAQAPADYSSRREQKLIAGGRSGLRLVLRAAHVSIYEVPSPTKIVAGPGHPRVVRFRNSHVIVALDRPGRYRIAVRYSPYWHPSDGCVRASPDGLVWLDAPRAEQIDLRFDLDPGRALATVAGTANAACAH